MAWGSSSLRSCTSLWERLERNDPSLKDLFILPTKNVTTADWERCIRSLLLVHAQPRHLESIHASGHAIDLDSLQQLSSALHETSLQVPWKEIAIGDSKLGDEGVTALLSAWKNNSQIASLDLSYKNLSSSGWQSLKRWAATSEYLTKLDLSRNPDLVKGLEADDLLVDGSASFTALQEINLSECNLEGETGAALVSLFACGPKLRILQLGHNALGPSVSKSLFRLSPSLIELSLTNCGLTDKVLQTLVPSLSKLQELETLDLSQNSLTTTVAALVAKGLAEGFGSLQTLNLSGNALQGEGVKALIQQGCKIRSNQPALVLLDLSHTQCSAESAHVAIASSGVQNLRLFDNAFGSDGFAQLGETLQGGHATMYSLDVAGNGANEEAVVTFLRGLLDTSAGFESVLKTVVVGGNQGGPALEELIQQIKSVRPGIDIARDRVRKQS